MGPSPPPSGSRSRGALESVFGLDPRSLATFRIGLGSLLLVDLAFRVPSLSLLYGERGWVATSALPEAGETLFFFYQIADAPGPLALVFSLTVLSALAMALGYRTRWATAACWLLVGSLHAGNPILVNYGDRILHALLFWGLFLPLGARFSLDARRRAGPAPTAPVLSFGSAGLVLQFVCIYLMAALLKTGPEWHGDANAIQYVLREEYVVRASSLWLVERTEILGLMTRLVYVWEVVAPLVLLIPLPKGVGRIAVVLSIWIFHLGLAFFMRLGVFPFFCIAGTSVLLPALLWGGLRGDPAVSVREAARPWARRIGATVAAAAALFLIAQNAATWAGRSVLPGAVHRVARFVGLNQRWGMYAPAPAKTDGFHVFAGTLADGSTRDLHSGASPVSYEPPPLPWGHADLRIAMFVKHLPTFEEMQWRVATRLCHDWNAEHSGDQQLASIQLVYVEEERGSFQGRGTLTPHRLAGMDCSPESPLPPPR